MDEDNADCFGAIKSPSPLMSFGVERTAVGVRSDAFVDEAILLDQCEIPVRLELSADENDRPAYPCKQSCLA